MQRFNKRNIRILLFFVIALSTSVLFRYDVFGVYKNWNPHPIINIFKTLVEALGPFIGAIIITKIFNVKREISFLGNLKSKSLVMLSIPVICMAIIGIENSQMNNHIYGVLIGIWIVIYGILEETGWRGYLQDELKEHRPIIKYVIVGIMWYIWHLTFLGKTTIINELFVALILIASSMGIGYVADKSKSIFAASGFHIIGNILGLSPLFSNVLKLETRIIIVVICVVIWITILKLNKNKI